MSITKEATMSAGTINEWVELADRAGDGLEVRLFWNSADGRVKVTVAHLATDRVAKLEVSPEDAMEAFHHPFAYQPGTAGSRAVLSASAL